STRGQGQSQRHASRHLCCAECLQLYATVAEPWIAEQREPLASYEVRLGLVTRHRTALQSETHPPLDPRGQMQPTRIGNFEVARVADYEGPFFAPGDFFPDFDPAVVEENAALLGPRLIEPGTGKLIFSFHRFVIKTGRHTILVDACIGNDKERPTGPQCRRMKSPFIEDLARLG